MRIHHIFKDIELENLNSIETIFFRFTKVQYFVYASTFLSWRIRHFKKIILEGRGFRGGSDEKMRRMWLGLEIVVGGLPPLGIYYLSNKQF